MSWNWKANGSGSSNSDGAISSTVSANQTAGFSIVTFTMPGSGTTTIGHGLGAVPDLIFAKSRGSAAGWITWDKSLTNSQALQLNDSAAIVSSTNIWGLLFQLLVFLGQLLVVLHQQVPQQSLIVLPQKTGTAL